MISISNDDARTILQLLERAPDFYRNHAVHSADLNDARRMSQFAKKLKKKLGMAQCDCAQVKQK